MALFNKTTTAVPPSAFSKPTSTATNKMEASTASIPKATPPVAVAEDPDVKGFGEREETVKSLDSLVGEASLAMSMVIERAKCISRSI